MTKNVTCKFTYLIGLLFLSACTQYTPSMMNNSPVQLSQTTMIEQIMLKDIHDETLSLLANHYHENATSALDLTMTYDPKSKSFTAMNAVHELKQIKDFLSKKGIKNILVQTQAVPNGTPSLMVSYDMVQAMAPADCTLMPGLDKANTTRFIGEYKFGCSTETMVAKQVARPSDLQGNATMDQRSARRDAIILNGYSRGEPRTPLEGIEREDLATE